MKIGVSHARSWKYAEEHGIENCFWCQRAFHKPSRPPTMDHMVPKSLGGNSDHGVILACQSCNSARGNIPFAEYLEAVEIERHMCKVEKRNYRAPRRRLIAGEYIITTMTRAQIREAQKNRAAVFGIGWLEPHDQAADQRWDRENAS